MLAVEDQGSLGGHRDLGSGDGLAEGVPRLALVDAFVGAAETGDVEGDAPKVIDVVDARACSMGEKSLVIALLQNSYFSQHTGRNHLSVLEPFHNQAGIADWNQPGCEVRGPALFLLNILQRQGEDGLLEGLGLILGPALPPALQLCNLLQAFRPERGGIQRILSSNIKANLGLGRAQLVRHLAGILPGVVDNQSGNV